MLKLGDKLVTKTLQAISDSGGYTEDLTEGKVVEVLFVDDNLITTDDGDFTIEPDNTGLSWVTFYNKQDL